MAGLQNNFSFLDFQFQQLFLLRYLSNNFWMSLLLFPFRHMSSANRLVVKPTVSPSLMSLLLFCFCSCLVFRLYCLDYNYLALKWMAFQQSKAILLLLALNIVTWCNTRQKISFVCELIIPLSSIRLIDCFWYRLL